MGDFSEEEVWAMEWRRDVIVDEGEAGSRAAFSENGENGQLGCRDCAKNERGNGGLEVGCAPHNPCASAPVEIPAGQGKGEMEGDDDEEAEDDGTVMQASWDGCCTTRSAIMSCKAWVRRPPHELAAAAWRRRRDVPFSVLQDFGRTLKGRELFNLRNAVWLATGFHG
ncbi:hypothetical protein L7F22_060881 [Adiantum nelumboides]|nr:hypothetical protein [Adiantum nelumboides]